MNLTSFSKNFWSRDYLSSKNVLVIPTTAIGDNLMLTAIVANLKEQYPHLNIYIKNNLTVQQIFKYHPAVTSLVNDSDKINYDAIIDYTNLIAKLPEYYNGLGFMDLMGNIAGIKFTEREIIFKISDVEIENARQEISNFSSKKIIGVHFSTSKDIKRSYQHGSELIRLINEQDKNTRFIHLGNEYVPGLDSSIVYDAALYSPELRKQIALSSFCDSFITIDSAFFHIGHNYFKKPTLGIFGLTNPELVGNHKAGFSYIRNESLNCLNCYWQIPCNIECMNNLKPEDIAKAFFNIKNNMIFGQDLKEEVINIEWDANPDDLLFNFFLSNRRALKPVINDFNNLLPEYSKNWNGIIINKSRNDRNTMNNTDIFPNNSGAFTIEGSKEINNNENQDNSQPLLLNLGCGDDIKKGFINIDLNGDDDRIVIMNVMNLDFPDNSVAVIYAADILPCFSYREIDDVLAEWNRVLIPGGKIIISCTSVKQICKLYMSGKINAEVMSRLIYGTQDNPLNFYLCGFDSDYLGSALKDAGFEIENIEESDDADNIDDINLSIVIIAKKADSNIDINNNIINNNNNFPESTLKFNFSEYDEDENQSVFRFEDENDSLKVFEDKKFIEPEEDIFSPNRIKDEINYLVDKNKPEKLKLNIVWEGSQFVYHSLALINREICYNLIKSDVADLTIIPYEKEQFLPDGNKKYETLKAHDIRFKPVTEPKTAPNPYIWIRHTWPPKSDEPKGAKWIIMQPWEFSTLRADFAETFKQADEIWTPSVFSRTSMTNSGIDFDKVQVIPNGIDPELWSPNGKRMNLKTVKKLKLLFVGGTIYRKGIDILLQAYIQSFSVKDNITLIIKDMGGDSFYRGQTAKNQIDSIKMNPNAPEIIYLDDYLTEEQMVELYKSCDVFVCPYRGEGFSIPTLEAMACGLPVVVTKGGSTDDFVDEEIGWLIPSIKKSVGKVLDNIPLTGEAFLLEPDLEKFIDILKGLYQEPSSIVSKGIVASKRARIEWTWKKSTIKALSRLDLMYETNMALEADTALENYSDDSIKLGIAEDAVKNSEFLKANDLFGDLINSTTLNDRYIQHAICRKVEMCLNLNDLISVDEYLNMAVRRFGYTTDIKYLKAYLLYLNGNTSDSLLILSELHNYWNTYKFETTIGLNQEELLVFTADNLFTDGDSKGALQLYLQAQKINPDNANSWYGAGMCYFSIQSNSEAKRMFLQTLKLNPDFEDARKMLEELGV